MAPTSAEIETADRLSRRRARMLPALAAIFVIQQAAYFAEPDVATRLVDEVKIGGLDFGAGRSHVLFLCNL